MKEIRLNAFEMNTVAFRCGCLTGPQHSGAELHGFLAYLMKCVVIGRPYTVFGYKGKQVRDNIHCADVVSAFVEFWQQPRAGGQVYNLGGGLFSNCSMLEAIEKCERIAGRTLEHTYQPANRIGDHICYYSDLRKMRTHYPRWDLTVTLEQTIAQIVDAWQDKLVS